MTTNDGVGKKIVEALKKQSESEVELTQNFDEVTMDYNNDNENTVNSEHEIETSDINQLYGESFNVQENNFDNLKEETFEIKENVQEINNFKLTQEEKIEPQIMPKQPQGWNFGIKEEPVVPPFVQPQMSESISGAKQFDMPPNVAVLKKLITQLPSGVTRQTGAQIIKQTMEALGISMNTVLHEAQKVQDDMNESIKNCMTSIQEYKNNIRNLEKQGLDYQRQVNQLNDLISLFILSDKD